MIQEIPDKVCKKCGSIEWYVETKGKRCADCTRRRARRNNKINSKAEYQKNRYRESRVGKFDLRTNKKHKEGPCNKCGSLDFYFFPIKDSKGVPRVKLDGSLSIGRRCRNCVRLWTEENRAESNQKHREYHKRRMQTNMEYKKKVLAQSEKQRIEGVQKISPSYVKSIIAAYLKIPMGQLELSKETYEEYRQSLLIHRKLKSLNKK
jgi:hypothetical protein